jgi:hypothetical protein
MLTVDEFRLLATTERTDAALTILLDAAAEDIVNAIGPAGAVTELIEAEGDLLRLGRPAQSIISVVEYGFVSASVGTTLSADDYELSSSGQTLRRLRTGTNPRFRWFRSAVTYEPVSDESNRRRVQLELVQLDLSYSPGISQETIGSYSVSHGSNAQWNYQKERAAILATLTSGIGVA